SAERGLNVKWFGAVGDGVNDDTEAFKDAMSHANKAPLFIPQGTYIINENINLTHSIIGDNALITTTMQGLEYLFTANGLDKISISGITVDCKLSRGAFKLTNIRIANVHDVEIKGYSAEYGWYRTDSAILYDSCEFVFANDVYIHDHGFEYGTAMNTLNRCFTIQGDNTKVVNLTRLTIKKANQGIILSTPNANVILSNSYIENTTDNSLYLLTCTTFKAIGCVFNDYYDESAIVASGDYGFRDCTWMNVPNKVVAIANDTTGLEITDSTILLSTDYSGNVVAFRDNTYVLNSFIFTGNRINVFPKITNTNDIFQFGQITYFNISNNTIKLSRMGAGQRLFSFRNTNEDQKTSGVMNGNYVIPLAGIEAIDGKYIFLKLDKENIDVTLNNNFTANGRIPLEHTKLYVNGNKLLNKIGTATQNHQQHTLFAEDMPISGFYHKGDIIWNTNPARNGIAAWLRLTDGNSNVIKTDWQVLKLSIS
ncbi:MAG: glycosyl hydrolase family 28-related protein, partial [Pseudoalteromonas prydzensis]